MKTVDDYARIRYAFHTEHKKIREIARELHCGRRTRRQAVEAAHPPGDRMSGARPAPALDPWKARIDALLAESASMPRKQRFTAHRIYVLIRAEGFGGGESTVRAYVRQKRPNPVRKAERFLPLAFDPGEAAEADWGEAEVEMAEQIVIVQYFALRLCYSRRMLVCAYPTQKQESFFDAHVRAFAFFGGVPKTIAYDNLKTAVYQVLSGRSRVEQQTFTLFRSHYLFESRYCTPGEGHEKGGVEGGIGFSRRNFLTPRLRCASFEDLNQQLEALCEADSQRIVDRQPASIEQMWREEQPHLRPLPGLDYECCVKTSVRVTPYSQVTYETNRYSVPADIPARTLSLRAYPFKIEALDVATQRVVASHPRCYGRKQDIYVPHHYLPLLERRPGAFQHARPMREWRAVWPAAYGTLTDRLVATFPEGRGIPELIRILSLHRENPARQVEQAVDQALSHGCAHFDGVSLFLRQIQRPESPPPDLDLSKRPGLMHLAELGQQPVDLAQYDQLRLEPSA